MSFLKALWKFLDGLIDRDFVIPRKSLCTWWPAFGTFFWFLYMGFFAASTLLLYSQIDKTGGTGYFFSGFLVLNIGIFVAMYLATLVDGSHGQETNPDHPFTLSLQACFIESLCVVAALLWTIGRHLINAYPKLGDLIPWANNVDPNATGKVVTVGSDSYLVGLLSLFWDKSTSLGVWVVLGVLAFVALLIAHEGFRLIGRRHDLTTKFQGDIENTDAPPINSTSLKKQIAHLEGLRKELLRKAEREDTFATDCTDRKNRLVKQLGEVEKQISALEEELRFLRENQESYAHVHAAIEALQKTFSEITADVARQLLNKFYTKITALVGLADRQLHSGKDLFEEEVGRLEKRIADDIVALERLSYEINEEEKKAEEHHQESARLYAEAKELGERIAELGELAAKIDDTNAEWPKSYHWEATVHRDRFELAHAIPAGTYSGTLESDSIATEKIKKGTFTLFLLATFLLVVNDLLAEAHWAWPKPGLQSATVWKDVLYFCGVLVLLWAMKGVSLIGFMGSWRTIMASEEDKKDGTPKKEKDSEPSFGTALKVVGANTCGAIAFAVLFAIFMYFLNSTVSADCTNAEQSCTAMIDWMGMKIDIAPLLVAIKQLYVLQFLGFTACLVIAAPLAVYLFEKQRRKENGFVGIKMFGIMLVAILGAMLAGSLGALIGDLGTKAITEIKIPEKKTTVKKIFVERQPPAQTQMACPLRTIKLDGGNTMVATWNAHWLFGNKEEIAGTPEDLTKTNCKIHIGKYGNDNQAVATYIAIVSAESQEHYDGNDGLLSKERVNTIINAFVASSDLAGQKGEVEPEIAVYVWPLGLSNSTCKGCSYDQTAYQRPAFVIIGNETGEAAIQDHLRQATEEMLSKTGHAPTGASATLADYPKARKPQKWMRCADKTYQPTCSAPSLKQ